MTEFFDIIAEIITKEPFAIGAAILFVVILAVCYIGATYERGLKFTVLGEDEILVLAVGHYADGTAEFYCSDGNAYYAPIGSNIQEGDIIHKDDLIKFKQIRTQKNKEVENTELS